MKRAEIPAQDRWNVEAFYPSLEMWNKDFNKWKEQGEGTVWDDIKNFKGRLREGRESCPAAAGKISGARPPSHKSLRLFPFKT